MMNKSKIDWCDFSWNPVTGCRHDCEYCYARKQARRFSGDVRLNKRSDQLQQVMHFNPERDKEAYDTFTLLKPFKSYNNTILPFPVGFEPTLHEYRLPMPAQKKKPANIFVCSMADLFGDWVPTEWIKKVFKACEAAPQHNYLFLTKNPRRYERLILSGILPKGANYWYGSTITTGEQEFFISKDKQYNTFVSIEPILEKFPSRECAQSSGMKWGLAYVDWVILGPETGNRAGKVVPEREWIYSLADDITDIGIPLFMKDSLSTIVEAGRMIQEYPSELKHPEEKAIPRCKECEHCVKEPDGKRGDRYYCETGWIEAGYDDRGARHILGRYTRTSPPWCQKRGDCND